MANDWFYLNGEEQVGPYPGEQLHELISAETITRETLIWTEGMPEWLPASEVENLFSPEAVTAEPEAAPPAGKPLLLTGSAATQASRNPYTLSPSSPTPSLAKATATGLYPPVNVPRANYQLYLTFCLYIPLAIGLVILIILAIAAGSASGSPDGEPSDGSALAFGLATIGGFFIFPLSSIVGSIIGYVHLYRAWSILQPTGSPTTPGAAVGFLFIPLFNLYWVFVAYKSLAESWNATMAQYADTRSVFRMSDGLFLAYCIMLIVFSPVGLVLQFIAHSHICKGINSFVSRTQSTGNTPAEASGGLRLS